MNNFLCESIDCASVHIDKNELTARLQGTVTSNISELVELEKGGVISAARAVFCARRASLELTEDGVIIDGHGILSRGLRKCLSGTDEAIIFAVTLGASVDRYIARRRAVSESAGFIADAVASALAEAVCEEACRRICESDRASKRFSPGYGDLSLDNQVWLLSHLDAAKRVGITLTDSLLMIPTKSITAIMGVKNG